MSERRIIEINGVKIDVDMRTAQTVDTLKVGDPVRVLTKGYGESYTAHSGVVIGFDAFKELPTIVIAYLKVQYSEVDVAFLHFNAASKDCEVIGVDREARVAFDESDAITSLERNIEKAERAVKDAKDKKAYFIANIGKAWAVTASNSAETPAE